MAFNLKKYSSTLGGVLMSILVAIGSLFIIMILYFYVYLPQVTNHGETITVPNAVGMSFTELEDFLGNLDLRYEVSDSTYSGNQPPLTVMKQYPAAGAKVKENRVIYISLNQRMPPNVPVPNLIDGSLIDADAVLRSNELKRGKIELVRGPFQIVTGMKYKGHPIEPGERVPKGSVIDLVVMDGGKSCDDMISLLGKEWDEAILEIRGNNLNPDQPVVVGDTTGIVSVVLKQKPEAGETICVGDIVTIWIGAAGTPVEDDY